MTTKIKYPFNNFKVILLGDANVGKTSLLDYYYLKEITMHLSPTVGLAFSTIENKEKNIRLDIWDSAGSERFRAMVKMYYRECDIVFLIYDLNDPDSIENIINYWYPSLHDQLDMKNTMFYLIGNKLDNALLKEQASKVFQNDLYYKKSHFRGNSQENIQAILKLKTHLAELVENNSMDYLLMGNLNYQKAERFIRRCMENEEKIIHLVTSAFTGYGVKDIFENIFNTIEETGIKSRKMIRKELEMENTVEIGKSKNKLKQIFSCC